MNEQIYNSPKSILDIGESNESTLLPKLGLVLMFSIPVSFFVTMIAIVGNFNEITTSGSGDPKELARMLKTSLSYNVYGATIGVVGSFISFFSIRNSTKTLPYKFRYPIFLLIIATILWACAAYGIRGLGIVGAVTTSEVFPSIIFLYMVCLSIISGIVLVLFIFKRKMYYAVHQKHT